ncbi:MAG: ankyrin repeat domain-containing protein [Rickettsia endosymbiont of Pentastiridius leporinus]
MLNKLYKILFLINLLLGIAAHQAYAVPPALPPSLPNVEDETKSEHKKATSDSEDSIFDKFKQFFAKSKKKEPVSQTKIKQEDDTKNKKETKLAVQEPVKNEPEVSEPFMDVGDTKLPSAASNELHLDNVNESNANLASHNDNNIQSTEKPNKEAEPFMDVGNTTLPSAASNEFYPDNINENSSTNFTSHNDNNLHSPQKSVEETEQFMDVGDTRLSHAGASDLHNDEMPPEVQASNPANENSTNLASLPVTPNVPNPLVVMPPLRPGSYVVPPSPPVQIYKPTKLPEIRKPVPLNPPEDAAANASEPSNQVPQVAPVPAVAPSVPNMPLMPPAVVNTPVVPNVTPNNLPAKVTPAATPALTPATPNIPTVPTPVVNTPVAPNTTPNNLPAVVPANQIVPPATPIPTPAIPSAPNVPHVSSTTDSSKEINNSKKTIVASQDPSMQQGWDDPLKPVEVLSDNQDDTQNDTQNQSASNIQNIVPTPQVQQPINSPIQKQDNKENTEVTESAEKFAKNETQMLLLPNDDVVLGKLTEEAALEQMDIYSYIKLAQQKEAWIANADRRKAVENFIKYDDDLDKKKDIYATLSYCSAVDNAFRAIDRNSLSKLRVLLDVYPILQQKNKRGNNLLTAAVYNDNYYLAKYLVIRGIKISTLNSECQYPLDIALANGNSNIACMLLKAKGYN